MFWKNFYNLCQKANKSPNAVAKELGISSGAVTSWKNGKTPHHGTLIKIAQFFEVSTDFLLGVTPTADTSPPPVKPDTVGTPVEKKGYSPPGTFGAGISPEEVEELSEGFSPVQKELFRTVLALDNKDAAKAIQLIQLILERDNGEK